MSPLLVAISFMSPSTPQRVATPSPLSGSFMSPSTSQDVATSLPSSIDQAVATPTPPCML